MNQQLRPVIWCLLDGRPGHENQVLGLTEAICRRITASTSMIDVTGRQRLLRALLRPHEFAGSVAEAPDLLIAAGRRTHLPLLSLQRRFGGRSVVILKPGLPLSWFDLCLIPDHDQISRKVPGVHRIRGALNRIEPSPHQHSARGLILIGGPSRHFVWNTEQVVSRLRDVIHGTPTVFWTVVTSERTPPDFMDALSEKGPVCQQVDFRTTDRAWLPRAMSEASTVWVTNDSVSMIHEALTAGCAVGILDLKPTGNRRISQSLMNLVSRRQATLWSDWQPGQPLPKPDIPLQESDRCADLVIAKYLQHALPADSSLNSSPDRPIPFLPRQPEFATHR